MLSQSCKWIIFLFLATFLMSCSNTTNRQQTSIHKKPSAFPSNAQNNASTTAGKMISPLR